MMISRTKLYGVCVQGMRPAELRRADDPCSSQSSSNTTAATLRKLRTANGTLRRTKKMHVPLIENEIDERVQEEIDKVYSLGKYHHPNIVKLLSVQKGQKVDSSQILVLKFESSDMDLSEYLLQGLDPHTVKDLTHQILRGLDFIHKQGIVHGNLRPQKIIVTDEGTVKLAEYGLRETMAYDKLQKDSDDEGDETEVLAYYSPERLLGSYKGTAMDVWAVGCIMAEMYMCTALFEGATVRDQLDSIFSVIGTPRLDEWPKDAAVQHKSFPSRSRIKFKTIIPEICNEGADLLNGLLKFEHCQRITVSNSLHHPYFSLKSYMMVAKAVAAAQGEASDTE